MFDTIPKSNSGKISADPVQTADFSLQQTKKNKILMPQPVELLTDSDQAARRMMVCWTAQLSSAILPSHSYSTNNNNKNTRKSTRRAFLFTTFSQHRKYRTERDSHASFSSMPSSVDGVVAKEEQEHSEDNDGEESRTVDS